jgi:predicted TIM-barrel fold metal-dependent hydrolase
VGAPGLIDVHQHLVPPDYRAAIDAAIGSIGGIPQPDWSEDAMLERMATLSIDRAVLSVSAPALAPITPSDRPALARTCNQTMADVRARHPGAIGGFALLPLPDVDATLIEIAYALDVLRLDGVALLTNYEGRYLDDRMFAPVLAELDRRGVVAHVHPNLPPPMPDARLSMPAPVLEFTFDTTRMIGELILTETLGRYRNLRLVLSHLGGTLPWAAWRLSMLDDVPSAGGGRREPVRDQLRRMYYDVALSATPEALQLAGEVVGTDRLLYGSDFPFAPAAFIDKNTRSVSADLVARTRDNTQRLFG